MDGSQDPVEVLAKATALAFQGQLGAALALAGTAAKLARETGHDILAGVLIQRAGWLRESGQTTDGLADLAAAEQELNRPGRQTQEFERATLKIECSRWAELAGNFAEAENLLAQARVHCVDSPAADLIVPDILANQASLYMHQGRLGRAQDALLEALDIDNQTGNQRNIANDLNMLGLVYEQLGDVQTARSYLERSLNVAIAHELAKEGSDAASNLAVLMDNSGQHSTAADVFGSLERCYVKGDYGVDEACAVSNQGVAALLMGDLTRAQDSLSRGHQLHLETENWAHACHDLANLSQLEVKRGDSEKALRIAQDGLSDARRYGLPELEWRFELIVAQRVLGRFTSRLSTRSPSQEPDPTDTNDLLTALEGLDRAADIIELLRARIDQPGEREWFLGEKELVYELAFGVNLALGRAKDAFRYVERGRARAFLDALGADRLDRLDRASDLGARRHDLVSRLLDPATDAEQKPALLDELRIVRAEIVARQPAMAAVTETELPTLDAICAAIPTGTCLLEFYVLTRAVALFLMDHTGLRDAALVPCQTPLEELVRQHRDDVVHSDVSSETGGLLYAMLVNPMMRSLQGVQNLVVVPNGALHLLPWAALWFDANDGEETSTTPTRVYLRQQFLLSSIPSASYLAQRAAAQTEGPHDAAGPTLVLGNPTGDLPGAGREAESVAARLGTRATLGSSATRTALLSAQRPRVLHVAAHGSYRADDPLLSGLHMADGLVTVEDLLTQGPRADLMVLSGCVTGLSDRRPGDELVGLARAAILTGTQAIVVSLWETSDEASSRFFHHFYTALCGGVRVCEAIAWAQQELSAEDGFEAPADWAPFLLIGDRDLRVFSVDVDGESLPPMDALGEAVRRLRDDGDASAVLLLEAVIACGEPRAVASAHYALGVQSRDAGDGAAARQAFEQAASGSDAYMADLAQLALGHLLEDAGDIAGAAAAFRLAMTSADAEIAPRAANNLGAVLREHGDLEGAKTAFQLTAASGHPEFAGLGAHNLAVIESRLSSNPPPDSPL
jgi:CHAT domain-containing protein/Tfp pilus assembly protein PilF